MSDDPNKGAGGTPDPDPVDPPQDDPPKAAKDSVAYGTYQKVLGEKKRAAQENSDLRERLAALETADKERQEDELKEQNKYKELLELREKEAAALKAEADQLKEEQRNVRKLNAVVRALPSELPRKYWRFVDLNSVIVNPDTEEVDEMSAKSVAEGFIKEFPEAFGKPGAPKDNQAPVPNGSGEVTLEALKAMKTSREARESLSAAGAPDWMTKA